ncbi:MAG: hypothetical protein V3U22_02980, partial [Vicinamibacteria bacterium]
MLRLFLLPRLRDTPEDLFELPLPERGLAVVRLPVDSGFAEPLLDREPVTLGRRLKKSLLPTLLPVPRLVALAVPPALGVGRRMDEVEGLPGIGPAEPAEPVDGRLRERPVAVVPELRPVALRSGPTPVRVRDVPSFDRDRVVPELRLGAAVSSRCNESGREVGAVWL